ncbi:MAG: Aromatic-amino-acid aminotransferase 2 [ANME-2 cluster archaeon]|nr:Aromatic-amino-acid aminotransferase 2 [ANME-2 cluster archaeon]
MKQSTQSVSRLLHKRRMRISDTVQSVPPSGIRRFFDLANELEDVISLGVGEPDFVTPWHIRESCIHALEQGHTSYTSNQGLPELREEIADTFRRDHSLHYDPNEEILITTGVSEGIDLAMRAILNRGDEVIVPEPCYVSYVPTVIFAGGVPVTVATGIENDFKVTAERIEDAVTEKTRAIMINYPNNPTGATMGKKDLEEIADVAIEHDLIVISDEIYDKLTYDGKHTCFSSLNGMIANTVVFNGFSKSHAMTGLRVGYALGSSDLIGAMTKIHQYTMLCAPITSQMAAIDALRNGRVEMERMVREYDRRRHLIISGFNKIGLDCFWGKGAFYAFPSIAGTGMTADEFAERLMLEKQVAVVPGNVFGDAGTGFLRCSYAASRDDIKEALARIGEFVESIAGIA